jgi:hypothetical protein
VVKDSDMGHTNNPGVLCGIIPNPGMGEIPFPALKLGIIQDPGALGDSQMPFSDIPHPFGDTPLPSGFMGDVPFPS